MPRTVFRLHAHCIPVRGARRSTVCDLQRRTYRLIPNVLHDILTTHRDLTREEIGEVYGAENAPVLEQYFAFLAEHELGWWTDEPECFPELDLTWDAPCRVTNAVIDVGAASRHDFASLIAQVEALGCRALQLRWFVPVSLVELDGVAALTDRGRLRSLELVLPHDPAVSDDDLFAFCRRHPRVISLFVHGAPARRLAMLPNFGVAVVYRPEAVTSEAHCGHVHPSYFVTNLGAFTEARAHNSCLNRKLAVDQHGWIRNCPAMPRAFGRASDTPLAAALEAPGFRDAWSITKDQVETCRDCEFRYVCTDCRAFVRDPGDPLSRPARCGYDPYTATWAPAGAGEPAGAAPA